MARSNILARAVVGLGGNQTLATVPTGERWIVKNVQAGENNGTAAQCDIYAHDAPNNIAVWWRRGTLGANAIDQVQTWTVLEAGDVITVDMGNTVALIWVSGTKLTV